MSLLVNCHRSYVCGNYQSKIKSLSRVSGARGAVTACLRAEALERLELQGFAVSQFVPRKLLAATRAAFAASPGCKRQLLDGQRLIVIRTLWSHKHFRKRAFRLRRSTKNHKIIK